MNKQILILRDTENQSYTSFKEQVFEKTKRLIGISEIQTAHVTVTETPPPRISIIPFKRKKIAVASFYGKELPSYEYYEGLSGLHGIYQVTEAFPVSYERDWPDNTITPGVCLLTLFRKRKGLDREKFIHRWHNSHTPLSLKIHPLWHYSRNVVETYRSENGEAWDGIVEEHVSNRSELINPFKFFGPFPIVFRRMWQVYSDTRSFLDYGTIETYLVREYHLKS